jgi:hypothetical protein
MDQDPDLDPGGVIFRFLTSLRVITKPRNYDVITRFRNYLTTLIDTGWAMNGNHTRYSFAAVLVRFSIKKITESIVYF